MKIRGLAIAASVLMALLLSAGVLAQAPPFLPHAFYGSLQVYTAEDMSDLQDAPVGVVVTAEVDDVVKGSLTVTTAGQHGGPAGGDAKLTVQDTIPSGKEILFYVNGYLAEEIRVKEEGEDWEDVAPEWVATFTSGEIWGLDLIAKLPFIPTPPGPPGPGPGPGGGGPGGEPPPEELTIEVDITGDVHEVPLGGDGELLGTIEGCTTAGDLCVTIEDGTTALDEDGDPLTEIEIAADEDPECPPPEDAYIIGLPYSFEPAGATFDPPLELTFTYEEGDIPEDVAEEALRIAYCCEVTGDWVVLGGIVNTADNTITVFVDHFTTFAVIGFITPPPPAAFTPSSLSISPPEVDIGGTVIISISVANTGGQAGSYTVTLKVDGVVEKTTTIIVDPGTSEDVTFTTAKDVAGTYSVDVNGLTGSFEVVEEVVPPEPAAFTPSSLSVSPTEVDIGGTVIISISVANTGGQAGSYTATLKINGVVEETKEVTVAAGASEQVNFTTSKDVAGTYSVDVNGLTGSFEVVLPPKPPINWPLIGGIIGGVIVVGLLIYFLVFRRRRAYKTV